MAPPVYADLGKSAKDVFNKGYNIGVVKLECKTTTHSGVGFTTSGTYGSDSKVAASLESKYKVKCHGLTFTEKWNTDNTVNATVAVENKLLKGLDLKLDTSFALQNGNKKGVLKGTYKHDFISVNADVDLNLAGPVVNACAVLRYEGWLAGYQMSFDSAKSKLTKSNFAAGYSAEDFTIHTNVNDGKEFGSSIHQRVNSNLETGIQLSWVAGSNATSIGVGCKYQVDKNASCRAKINNSCQIGLGHTQKIRDGVELTLSALIEGKSINQGGHKLGLGITYGA